ncbi:MAG: XRE family transcriptional regulator [Clostridium sp.]|nr:XRE family transcriptional regulator [Clostridium sp.]
MLYDNVRALCDSKGISVGRIEKDLGFSNGSICKWNENEPSARKLCAVAKILGTTSEKLLEDESAGERRAIQCQR